MTTVLQKDTRSAHIAPQLLSGDESLHENDTGILVYTSVTIEGVQRGAVHVEAGAFAQIRGTLEGSRYVGRKASVRVWGNPRGAVRIARGGTVVIGRTGHVTCTVHVDGLLDNHGERSGLVRGTGSIRDHAGSTGRRALRKRR